MDHVARDTSEPLPYAKEWRGPNQVDALNGVIFGAGILVAVVPLVPTLWFVTRSLAFDLRFVLTLASLGAHFALLVGSVLGLLQARAGRWVTLGSLVAICACSVINFFALTIPSMRPALRTTSGATMYYVSFRYYVSFSTSIIWVWAFTAVAGVALLRRR
jgi:hypothetical protein